MFACSGSALTESMETPARTAATTADFTVENVEKVRRKGQETSIHPFTLLIHFNLCTHDDGVAILSASSFSPGVLKSIHKAHLMIIYRLRCMD